MSIKTMPPVPALCRPFCHLYPVSSHSATCHCHAVCQGSHWTCRERQRAWGFRLLYIPKPKPWRNLIGSGGGAGAVPVERPSLSVPRFLFPGCGLCGIHSTYVRWDLLCPVVLLPAPQAPFLEEKAVQQGTQWNRWWAEAPRPVDPDFASIILLCFFSGVSFQRKAGGSSCVQRRGSVSRWGAVHAVGPHLPLVPTVLSGAFNLGALPL